MWHSQAFFGFRMSGDKCVDDPQSLDYMCCDGMISDGICGRISRARGEWSGWPVWNEGKEMVDMWVVRGREGLRE